jgi:hypothetical protein
VNAMVKALTSPPTVNALTTLKTTHINWGKGKHRVWMPGVPGG